MASAAILAGGRASRFGGRDKGALVWDGETILSRQLTELAAITDDILLVGRPDQPCPAGVRRVCDRIEGAGPLGGLDAALAAARDDTLVLLACDMPFPNHRLLAYMIELAEHSDGVPPDCVVPLTDRGYHPLCAVYTRRCGPAVADRLDRHAGDRIGDGFGERRRHPSEPGSEGHQGRPANHRELRMTGLLEDVRVRPVTTAELECFGAAALLFANVNTPADLGGLEALLGHQL